MPIKIIWTRGKKKAETKKKLLTESVHTATFNEKFEVSTQMEVGMDGRPTRAKNSQLVIASDK